MKINILLFLFILLSINVFSQNSLYVDSLIKEGKIYKFKDPLLSKKMVEEALKISVDSNFITRQIDALNLFAFLNYFSFFKYDTAYYYVYKALDLSKKYSYRGGVCDYYVIRGFFYQNINNYVQAKKMFIQAIEIAKEIDDKKLMANAQQGLALNSLIEENMDEAFKYVNNAIKNYSTIDHKYGLGESLFFKSYLFDIEYERDSVFQCLNEARNIFKELNDTFNLLKLDYAEIFDFNVEVGYKKKVELLQKCLNFPVINNEIKMLRQLAMINLSIVYEELGNLEKAYSYLKRSRAFSDSAYSIKQLHQINNMQFEYEYALKEQEKQALERENLLIEKKDRIVIWSSTLILLQAIVFIIILYNKYKTIKLTSEKMRKQEKLIYDQEKEIKDRQNAIIKEKLETKKRELAMRVFQIFQGNQMNNSLLSKLKALKLQIKTRGEQGEEIRGNIQEMINELNFSLNIQIWDEFEVYFNKVTPGFKKWLVTAYPNLTNNEIRLSIFSQLNLKTKEISNITFQTKDSIDSARSRLRKKFEIKDTDISISSFLNNKFLESKKPEMI